ncbi:MBL fold metallo-hydrolase [Nocardioides sp. TRM66260-LWL]|uniref:MBL fold metallo-hydrolase n=1 Tax=Nocardioides sp. TRM66260-LWL TaxID=2874478 RepID=UPI001CC789BF|nr:MBL fold metallo-hydrolase [Nocardioides sp. TRM66260-LWL]MBZ5734957.1 MBL fold metallo-hydrolase [Nocardioides sp. TRM66260-LWL]
MILSDSLQIGDVTVTRVVEWTGGLLAGPDLLPDSTPDDWGDAGLVPMALQAWVVRSRGATIVVDPGEGNDRTRPQAPALDHLATDHLAALAAAGAAPEDVDVVIDTHVHHDHVGWNTRLDGDAFVPTFPQARYLIAAPDVAWFDPARAGLRPPVRSDAERVRREGSLQLWADSVQPVLDAGLVDAWEGSVHLDDQLALELTPGHTPGSSVLWIRSAGETAVLVGDLLHTPLQLAHPDWSSCFCEDPVAAARTRRRVLEQAADEQALLVPAHLPGHGAVRIERDGSRFRVVEWADLAEV